MHTHTDTLTHKQNYYFFSVSKVHIHSCATTLDKLGMSERFFFLFVFVFKGGRRSKIEDVMADWLEGLRDYGGEGGKEEQTSTSTELHKQ